VKTIREFRNRLFHHEPAWKRFNVSNELDASQHLQEKIDRIEELIILIHPEKTKLLVKNGFFPTTRRLCTVDEIRRYQQMHKRSRIGTMRKLQAAVDAAQPTTGPSRLLLLAERRDAFWFPLFLSSSAAVSRPGGHYLAPLLEEVAPLVGEFRRIADCMGETRLDHLTRRVGLLRGPVAER
jgi:hypothetical protein